MIKIITIITKFIIVTLTALLFASCEFSANMKSIRGNGHVTSEKRIVQGDFKSVKVSNGIDLVIEQSDQTEIIVEADDNLQKEITTKAENGVLIISCDYNSYINIKSKKVTVKMPLIDKLEASSSSTIISINTLKGENVSLKASSAGSITVNLEADSVFCKASSGSTITVSGKALKVEATSSSGSKIEAKDLLANDITANSSSGGSILVHPLVSLKAKASSGSAINYNIVPKTIIKEERSGASISKQ